MSGHAESSEKTTESPQQSPELEKLRYGLQMGEFFAMDDAAMERAAQLLIADDEGHMSLPAQAFLEELDRRATNRHTKQVEAYAKRLDWLTTWFVGLTVGLVVLTVALIALELGVIGTRH